MNTAPQSPIAVPQPPSPNGANAQAEDALAALINEGLQASQAGHSQTALAAWHAAAQRAANPALPYVLIASEHASLGDFGAAEQWFTLALIADPEHLIARYQLGLLQYTSARVEAAFLTWAPLLQPQVDHPLAPALVQFVNAFVALTDNNHMQAQAQFRDGIALLPTGHPLAADAQRLIDQIAAAPQPHPQRQPQDAAAAGNPPVQPTSTAVQPPEDEPTASTHYLIANYGRSVD